MGKALKIVLYVFGAILLIGGLILIGLSQGAQEHTKVSVDALSGKAMVFKLSASEDIRQLFGTTYTLTVHFKTSNGVVVDVFLTDPKYIDEYSHSSGVVHYYKHVRSDEGNLEVTIPMDKEIAVIVIDGELSSTMVNLDLTTNISDTLFWGGILFIIFGIALIIGGALSKTSKKQIVSPQGGYVPPPPPSYQNSYRAGDTKEDIMEKLIKLKQLYEEGIISEEEYEKKKKELLDRL